MPKNKDPAVLFYPSDFLSSTILWSDAEIGMYIKLLCLQFLQDGVSEDDLDTVCGDNKRVRSKFLICDDGLYRNPRMQQEKLERSKYLEKQRENGSKGGTAKAKKNYSTANSTAKANGIAPLKPNATTRVENENVNENINKDNTSDSTFSFSNKTTTTINSQACEGEDDRTADSRLRTEICDYFESVGYKSSPHIFIEYNEARGWQGPNGVDLRKNYRWMSYADEWERRERGWNGESEED